MMVWKVWCPACAGVLFFADDLEVARARARNHSVETGHDVRVFLDKEVDDFEGS